VPEAGSTYWSLIRKAADGSRSARSEFARRYESVARAYLSSRWRGKHLYEEIDDAVQEVFVDCFRSNGALGRVDSDRIVGLWFVERNLAHTPDPEFLAALPEQERQAWNQLWDDIRAHLDEIRW